MKLYAACSGTVITALETLQSLNKYHENWVSYRATAENLKQEKFMYLANSGIYSCLDDTSCFQEFVARCETIISSENINWASVEKSKCLPENYKNAVIASHSDTSS